MEFFKSMEPLMAAFWYVAIPASLIFLIQTILTFVGASADVDTDLDHGGSSHDGGGAFELFTLRNLINFLLGLSWTGISLYNVIDHKGILIFLSFTVGIAFVYFFFYVITQVQKLAEDNSFSLDNTLYKKAKVYLTIPGQRKGPGKVSININGAYHELEALTLGEAIPTGEEVLIIKIEQENLLIVEKINQ
ncbi:MAG: serine protease [Saprospiraceae bacterium]|nr:serine protease [Saprospiraceae bacterium]